ncbi:MAG: hypothetical protein QM756_34510 [Polyangiaceae bacterium]
MAERDAAEQDVQAAINAATTLLSRSLPAPPSYSKSETRDTDSHAERELQRAAADADQRLRRLDFGAEKSQVSGVGLV